MVKKNNAQDREWARQAIFVAERVKGLGDIEIKQVYAGKHKSKNNWKYMRVIVKVHISNYKSVQLAVTFPLEESWFDKVKNIINSNKI